MLQDGERLFAGWTNQRTGEWKGEFSVPPLSFQGGESGWRLNQLAMTDDLIYLAYVMNSP